MPSIVQYRIEVTPADHFFVGGVSFVSESGIDLLEDPIYVSTTNSEEPLFDGNWFVMSISGGSQIDILIDPTVTSFNTVCTNSDITWGSYGGLEVVVIAIYDNGSEAQVGSGFLEDNSDGQGSFGFNNSPDCITLEIPEPELNCGLATNLIVGEDYNVESDDGQQTGVFRITSIDIENCNACFNIISGDWATIDPEEDFDIKIFYNSTGFCVLNPSEPPPGPVSVDFSGPGNWNPVDLGYGPVQWDGGSCWEISADQTILPSPHLESFSSLLQVPGIHAIRFTISITQGNVELFVSVNSPVQGNFNDGVVLVTNQEPTVIEFQFDPLQAIGDGNHPVTIGVPRAGPEQLDDNLSICGIELLVDPSHPLLNTQSV